MAGGMPFLLCPLYWLEYTYDWSKSNHQNGPEGGIRVTREKPWSLSCSENAYMQTSFT